MQAVFALPSARRVRHSSALPAREGAPLGSGVHRIQAHTPGLPLKASGLPAAVVPRDRRLLFGLLTVLLPWAWSRASRAMADPDHPERLRCLPTTTLPKLSL